MSKKKNKKYAKQKETNAVEALVPQRISISIPKKDFIYAPLRNSLLPTPGQLKQALITVAGDPRPMLDILRKLAVADAHLLGVIETRKDALLGYEFKVEQDDSLSDDENEKIKCKEIGERLEISNVHDAIRNIINGVIYGHSVTLPKWNLDQRNQYAPTFEAIDFVHFAKKEGKLFMIADKNDKDFFLTVGSNADIIGNNDQTSIARWINNSSGLVWLPLVEDELIISMNNPFEGLQRDYLGGILRTALYLTLLKYYTIIDFAKFNELFGMPLRVGKFDPLLSGDAAVDILKTAVQNLGADASAVIDKTTEIAFVEGKTTGNGDNYEKFTNYVEAKQSILMLGQTLTSEVGKSGGNRALGQVHDLVRMDKVYADMLRVEQLLTKVVIKDYFFNYGLPPNGLYPKFKFEIEEVKDLEMMSTVISNLRNAGFNPSASWASEYFGIPEAIDETDSFANNNPLL